MSRRGNIDSAVTDLLGYEDSVMAVAVETVLELSPECRAGWKHPFQDDAPLDMAEWLEAQWQDAKKGSL